MSTFRRPSLLVVALAIAGSFGCGTRVRRAIAPVASTPAQLEPADRLVAEGCYDCLRDALDRYRDVERTSPAATVTARIRIAEGLLAVRERELGLTDRQYLARARSEATDPAEAFLLDVVAVLPRRHAGSQRAVSDADLEAMMLARRNRDLWETRLRASASESPLAAVVAVSFDCLISNSGAQTLSSRTITAWNDTPLMRFTRTCTAIDADGLAALLQANPRFVEINYFLGIAATLKGDLDGAEQHFQRAFDWRHDWPAATLAIANTAMTAEDFERAAGFYRQTLALEPTNADAGLGLARALSYAGQYGPAIDAANRLLDGHWYTGDAYYWRAWNETQLNRNEEAWADVGSAAKLAFTAAISKLTGVLAVRRGDLPRARTEFEHAHASSPDDCETSTLLGGVLLELQGWRDAMPILEDGVACLDKHDADLRTEIARLRARTGRERIVARREQEVASDARLRAQSWFNLAVAALNVGDAATARSYASRLTADDRFGERARQLLERAKP